MSAFHLVPEGEESSESPIFPLEDDHTEEFFTPPQSPAPIQWQNFNMGDFELLSASSLSAPPPTPITDELLPSSIIDALPPLPIIDNSEEPIQFWRSDTYNVTTNFSPKSVLPKKLGHDGSWHRCLSTSPNGELAALFGPKPAVPFTWSEDDVRDIRTGLYTWGTFDETNLRLSQALESQVYDEVEDEVEDEAEDEAEDEDSPNVALDKQV